VRAILDAKKLSLLLSTPDEAAGEINARWGGGFLASANKRTNRPSPQQARVPVLAMRRNKIYSAATLNLLPNYFYFSPPLFLHIPVWLRAW
jgi:hypothetical protein